MNKYLLTFKNKLVEEQYQRTCFDKTRLEMFRLIILCLILVFIVRLGQGLYDQHYSNVLTYAAMIGYFILQYLLVKRYKQLLRASLVLVNHVFTIYLLLVEESDDPFASYLRGANQMGSNMLCILTGEYSDAIFQLISIQTIRIVIVLIKSSHIEFYAIFSAIIVILYATKQFHEYHKALRSQFLLSLREKSWDNIFNQVIKDLPYLLMNFNEEELKFNITLLKNCEKIINNQEALDFLRTAMINNQTLEQTIFKEIKKFQNKHQDNYRAQLLVEFKRKKITLEYSVYYGNQPTILIIFKDLVQRCQQETKLIQQQQSVYYFNQMLKFCSMLLKVENKNSFVLQVKRKLLTQKFQKEISQFQQKTKRINLQLLFSKLQRIYSHKKINFFMNENIEVISSPKLLNLFFVTILEALQSQSLIVYHRVHFNHFIEFQFCGVFDSDSLKSQWIQLNKRYNQIITNLKISEKYISFKLYIITNLPLTLEE